MSAITFTVGMLDRRGHGGQDTATLMNVQCEYFQSESCRSCTLMTVPYHLQVQQKQGIVMRALADVAPNLSWAEPFCGSESGFRNKAKLVVGGTWDRATLGILDDAGRGVDLERCGLYEPGLAAVFPLLVQFIETARLIPYDVPGRSGELKYLLLTHSTDGDLMLRFVLRSQSLLARIRSQLGTLRSMIPQLKVISVNIQPEHKAILEGDVEFMLSDEHSLKMRLNEVTLHLRPRSFFQTNTTVAAGLYRQARDWIDRCAPITVADLYCGVGGFALHADAAGRTVTGIELSDDAIISARQSAQELRSATHWDFMSADATAVALADPAPELIIVNPPRRGIGETLAATINNSNARAVIYSSCNVQSLVKDLGNLPRFAPMQARLFDMFPQTAHHEVILLLQAR